MKNMENIDFSEDRISPERFTPIIGKWRDLLDQHSITPDPTLADSTIAYSVKNETEAQIATFLDEMYRELERVDDKEEYIKNHGPLNAYLAEMFLRVEEQDS